MKKTHSIITLIMSLFLFSASTTLAGEISNSLPESFKASINRMVLKVKATEKAEDKRQVIGDYLTGMLNGLEQVQRILPLNESDRIAVVSLSQKLSSDLSELNGEGRFGKVPDRDLNRFAGFIQQDLEQAGISGGGLYISTGVLILLVILIILF